MKTTAAVCVAMVLAVASPDSMVALITKPYWVAVFVVSYLIAPLAGRYIKRK